MIRKKEKRAHRSSVAGAVGENGMELGGVHIHENVIASVVRKATGKVEGVIRLAGSTLVNNIAELIGNKTIGDRAISVHMEGSTVAIEVKVNILYGYHVPTVAGNIQTVVVEEVEKITGLTVTSVNVIIQELDDAEDAGQEESDEI